MHKVNEVSATEAWALSKEFSLSLDDAALLGKYLVRDPGGALNLPATMVKFSRSRSSFPHGPQLQP